MNKESIISELKVFGRSQCVLIAEPTLSIAKNKADNLLEFFSETFVTTTTEKTIRRFKQHPYDIVIVSLINTMRFNALETIDKIKSMNPNQSIIVLASEFEQKTILPLFDLGISCVLMVPYDEDEFILKVMQQSEKIYFNNMLQYGNTCKIDDSKPKEKLVFNKTKQNTKDNTEATTKPKKKRTNVFNKRVDEEISAIDFINILEDECDVSISHLIDDMQELDQHFEGVTNDFISDGINEEIIDRLVEILYSYEDQINKLIRFSVLAQAFGNLASAIENADKSLVTSKVFDLLSYVNDDLSKFINNVFTEQNVSNIHYLDDSLITSMEQIVINLSPTDDDDDDDDLELF
jgi:DNA-binding NarL/FixJ family response regulator